MHLFIDESGNFIEGSDWGVVCALALPHKEVGPTRRELIFQSRGWPNENGELKGRLLDPIHIHLLIDILHRHSALLHCCAIYLPRENFGMVARHRHNQCEGLTRLLTEEHHPELVKQVWELRRILEKMPLQLYIQCVLQSELVSLAVEESVSYFAQRRPRELGLFEWSIDAKDVSKVTTQENWWRDTLGPLIESKSMDRPMMFVRDESFDVSSFLKSFSFIKDQWYPDRPREKVEGFDIKKIVTDRLEFKDSKSDILLQAVDILANYLRRSLSGKINDDHVAISLGRLQIPRKISGKGRLQSVRILTISGAKSDKPGQIPGLKRTLDLMTSSGRPMILKKNRS